MENTYSKETSSTTHGQQENPRKKTQNGSQIRPKIDPELPQGPSWKQHHFFHTFFTRFKLPIGLPLGLDSGIVFRLIFRNPSKAPSERLRTNFGSTLPPFWESFGSFSGHLRKVKTELSSLREPHFHCSGHL